MILRTAVLCLVEGEGQFGVVVRHIHALQGMPLLYVLYLQLIADMGRFVLEGRPTEGVVAGKTLVDTVQERHSRQSDAVVAIYDGGGLFAEKVHPQVGGHIAHHADSHRAVAHLPIPERQLHTEYPHGLPAVGFARRAVVVDGAVGGVGDIHADKVRVLIGVEAMPPLCIPKQPLTKTSALRRGRDNAQT